MDEPIDVEFREIGSSNLPAVRSTVPEKAAKLEQFNDDRDEYPIENHLWALQNGRLMCLGKIVSYQHQPRYSEPLYAYGYQYRGRSFPARMQLELLCDDNHLRNIHTIRNILCDSWNTSRDEYLTHMMGSIVNDIWGVPHGFLMREMLMEEFEYHMSPWLNNAHKFDITFIEAGGPSIDFYDFDTETHELNQMYKIQPPQQKLLR